MSYDVPQREIKVFHKREKGIVAERIIPRAEFQGKREAMRFYCGKDIGKGLFYLAMLVSSKRGFVLTIVGIETEEIEPTMAFVEIE